MLKGILFDISSSIAQALACMRRYIQVELDTRCDPPTCSQDHYAAVDGHHSHELGFISSRSPFVCITHPDLVDLSDPDRADLRADDPDPAENNQMRGAQRCAKKVCGTFLFPSSFIATKKIHIRSELQHSRCSTTTISTLLISSESRPSTAMLPQVMRSLPRRAFARQKVSQVPDSDNRAEADAQHL